MKRVVAMHSAMAILVAALATPALAAPRYVGFEVVCPKETYTLEVDPRGANTLYRAYFANLNKKLVQGDCEVMSRYAAPPPLP
jgi:predicted ATP-grasp superfamily ATP-dependent carboligase